MRASSLPDQMKLLTLLCSRPLVRVTWLHIFLVCFFLRHHNREVRFVWEKAAEIKSQALIAPVDQSVSPLCFNCTNVPGASKQESWQSRAEQEGSSGSVHNCQSWKSKNNWKVTKQDYWVGKKKLISPFLSLSVLTKPIQTSHSHSIPSHLKLVTLPCSGPTVFQVYPLGQRPTVEQLPAPSVFLHPPQIPQSLRFERHQSGIYICQICHPK